MSSSSSAMSAASSSSSSSSSSDLSQTMLAPTNMNHPSRFSLPAQPGAILDKETTMGTKRGRSEMESASDGKQKPKDEVQSSAQSSSMSDAPTSSSAASSSSSSSFSASSSSAPRSVPLYQPYPHRSAASRNVVHHLHSRMFDSACATRNKIKTQTRAHTFGKFELKRTTTAVDPRPADLMIMQQPSKVNEIVSAGIFLFALTQAGVCSAFKRANFDRLCSLNVISGEVIRSLFYNKTNNSLITVSVYRHDNFTSLRCRSTTFDAIACGKPERGISLFTSESLQWPGFVEFDDVNKKVLTFSAQSKKYKVWDLTTYALIYEINHPHIEEVKISPGIMLLIFKRTERNHVLLKIIAIDTGEVLKEIHQPLQFRIKVEFIEQFNEKLLVKQKRFPLQMIDVRDPSLTREVSEAEFPTPGAFIFLFENHFFLTFRNRDIVVWNFEGQKVATFEDHVNWYNDSNTNNIFINANQDTIISYCLTGPQYASFLRKDLDPDKWKYVKSRSGSINVSNIFTGKCLAKIEKRRSLKYPFHLLDRTQQYNLLTHVSRAIRARRGVVRIEIGRLEPAEDIILDIAYEMTKGERMHRRKHRDTRLTKQLYDTMTAMEAYEPPRPWLLRKAAEAAGLPPPPFMPMLPNRDDYDVMTPFDGKWCTPTTTDDIDLDDLLDVEIDSDNESPSPVDSSDDETSFETTELNETVTGKISPHSVTFARTEARYITRRPISSIAYATAVGPRASIPSSARSAYYAPPASHHAAASSDVQYPTLDQYRDHNRRARMHNIALQNITAVFYDEDANEMFTGNKRGELHVWSQ